MISNFTNTQRVAPVERKVLDTPDDAPLICSIGRFVPRKGFDVLIRAVAQMKNTYLWIVGDGPEAENLHALAETLGVEGRVRFAGWKTDPRAYVAAADVFAMASSHEPLGNVILEAWAQRQPVVSTRSEGPLWFMRDGENGLLVDIGDADGFAAAFRKIEGDAALAERLIRGGEHSLREQFSEEVVAGAYLKLFASQRDSSELTRAAA